MSNVGYEEALRLAKLELQNKNPLDIVANTGVVWNGETFEIPWLNKHVRLDQGSEPEQIIWHHYLLSQGPKQLRNRYINYKQVPGAAIYNDNFVKRGTNPMVKAFQHRLDAFLECGLKLGGTKANLGDMSFTLQVLPYTPVTYVIWQGDEEMPASGNILFDESVIEWMNAEDLVYLASLPVYMMLKM